MSFWERIKKSFQDYLARMEKSNKEIFGNGTPSCCSMNRDTTNKKPR